MKNRQPSHIRAIEDIQSYILTQTGSQGKVSLELGETSTTNTSFINRRRLVSALERLDDKIRTLSTEFFNYITTYREGNLETFVSAITHIQETLTKQPFAFKDRIHWTETLEEVTPLRKNLSRAYLTTFNEDQTNEIVADVDFWKCLDSEQIKGSLNQTPLFKALPQMFVDPKGLTTLNKLNKLHDAFLIAIDTMSQEYEKVIFELLKLAQNRKRLAAVEEIDFSKHEVTFLGTILTANITNVLKNVWSGVSQTCSLGNMFDDLKFLLVDPSNEFLGSDDNVKSTIDILQKNVTDKQFILHIENYRRRSTQLVDRFMVASKRITLITDELKQIPIKEDDGESEVIDHLCALCGLYSASLFELMLYVNTSVRNLEAGFEQGIRLDGHVSEIITAINDYAQKRKLT